MSHTRAHTAPVSNTVASSTQVYPISLSKSHSFPLAEQHSHFPSTPSGVDTPVGHHDPWITVQPQPSDMEDRLSELQSSWRGEDVVGTGGLGRKDWNATEIPNLGESSKKPYTPADPLPLPLPVRYEGSMSVDVLAEIMDSGKGRDKVLKCVQYSLRTYLYILSLIAGVRPLSKWFKSNGKRMKLAVSGLSLARKCLLLLNPLHPLSSLLSPNPTSATTLLRHLIDLSSAVCDDLYTLSRLGITSKRLGKSADKWANRFWLLTTLMGLWKLHRTTIPGLLRRSRGGDGDGSELDVSKEVGRVHARRKVDKELDEAGWTNRKLLADLVFVSYDVFGFGLMKEGVQCFAGLAAAFISTSKLYDQHWTAAVGKG